MSSIETENPNLGIPRHVTTRAFLEIAANLLDAESPGSALLRDKITTWVIPGPHMELPDGALGKNFVVTPEMCPILRLWPVPRDLQAQTNATRQGTLNISISLWVATRDPLDCMDLYGLVESAVSADTVARGKTLRARLQAITRASGEIEPVEPAYGRDPDADGFVMLAEGSISTPYRITSF